MKSEEEQKEGEEGCGSIKFCSSVSSIDIRSEEYDHGEDESEISGEEEEDRGEPDGVAKDEVSI